MFDFSWIRRNKGQGMVEYILIVVVVVGIVLVGYRTFGEKIRDSFKSGGEKIESESTTAFK
jgi:hypothetical protein